MRIQQNFVARTERSILDWLCARLPMWVTPDFLTALGVLGAIVAFAGYVGSSSQPALLWLASLGFLLNWFGDSLDGSLARSRRIERPRYGYFVDHSIDAICNSIIMIGLGLSGFVRMDVALFALNGYLLLSIFVFLKHKIDNVFQLSFVNFGPTELRGLMIGMNAVMYFKGPDLFLSPDRSFSVFDVAVGTTGIVFFGIFVVQVARHSRELAARERLT